MNNPFRSPDGLSRYVGGLSAGQRIAAGTLLLVMIVSAVWFAGPGAAGGMEPVLDQPFTDADLAHVTRHLQEMRVAHEVRGDGKVYVPSTERLNVLSDLFYANVLSAGGTERGFDALVKQMSAWDAPSKTERLFNKHREATVRSVISRFRGVRNATVIIDPTNERHVGGSILPTAMVDVQTQPSGSANPRQIANAAVNALTGAVANLSRDRVKVTIDGASFNAGVDELAGGSELLERKQQYEQLYSSKVRQLLSYVPDVLVSVAVDLNVQSMEEEKRIVDPESVVRKEMETELRVRHDDPATAPAQEPPTVVANAVPMIPELEPVPASAGGRTEETRSKIAQQASETVQKSRTPAGKETIRSAAVAVPRSYFVQIFRRSNRGAEVEIPEPDDAQLQPVVTAETGRIRSLVKNALGLETDAAVTVEPYEDALLLQAGGTIAATPTVTLTPAPASTFSVAAYLHEIALVAGGMLTMLLLTFLFRRVERVTRPAAPRGHEVLVGSLEEDHDHADEGGDEDNETHHSYRRVRDVVNEHPDEAARVMRGWIYQGQ